MTCRLLWANRHPPCTGRQSSPRRPAGVRSLAPLNPLPPPFSLGLQSAGRSPVAASVLRHSVGAAFALILRGFGRPQCFVLRHHGPQWPPLLNACRPHSHAAFRGGGRGIVQQGKRSGGTFRFSGRFRNPPELFLRNPGPLLLPRVGSYVSYAGRCWCPCLACRDGGVCQCVSRCVPCVSHRTVLCTPCVSQRIVLRMRCASRRTGVPTAVHKAPSFGGAPPPPKTPRPPPPCTPGARGSGREALSCRLHCRPPPPPPTPQVYEWLCLRQFAAPRRLHTPAPQVCSRGLCSGRGSGGVTAPSFCCCYQPWYWHRPHDGACARAAARTLATAGLSLGSPFFFFLVRIALKDRSPRTTNHQPPPTANQPPTANRQQLPIANQPPTANHCSVLFLWFCLLPMSWP